MGRDLRADLGGLDGSGGDAVKRDERIPDRTLACCLWTAAGAFSVVFVFLLTELIR